MIMLQHGKSADTLKMRSKNKQHFQREIEYYTIVIHTPRTFSSATWKNGGKIVGKTF